MKKREIRIVLREEITLYNFAGDLLDVIDDLQNMYDTYGKDYDRLELEANEVRDYYDTHQCFDLVGFRPETDKERLKRLDDVKKQKLAIEARERKEYERLKKKFESGRKKKPTELEEKRYKALEKKIEKKK